MTDHHLVLLRARGISKRFGGVQALSDVGFTINHGEIYGLIGPNGAGKTSLFNVLTGIYTPDAGEFTFDGLPLAHQKPHEVAARGIARTFQNIRLFANLSALENVMIGRHVRTTAGVWGAILRDARDLVVERPRPDPRDLAERVVRGDIDEAREEQRLAEPVAALLRPRPRRAEPPEATIVAVVSRERAVRAVPQRHVHARGIVLERARELERPRAAELGRDGVEQRGLVAPGAPELEALRARGLRGLGRAGLAHARIAAHGDPHVGPFVRKSDKAAALEPADRHAVRDVDPRREVVPGLIEGARLREPVAPDRRTARVEQGRPDPAAPRTRIHREHADARPTRGRRADEPRAIPHAERPRVQLADLPVVDELRRRAEHELRRDHARAVVRARAIEQRGDLGELRAIQLRDDHRRPVYR